MLENDIISLIGKYSYKNTLDDDSVHDFRHILCTRNITLQKSL